MIIRVFRARVQEGKEEEFKRFFLTKALPLVKSQPGLVSVVVGLPSAVTPSEFLMVTTWSNLNALQGFAGEQWQRAVIDPEEAPLLRETFVHHYDAMQP